MTADVPYRADQHNWALTCRIEKAIYLHSCCRVRAVSSHTRNRFDTCQKGDRSAGPAAGTLARTSSILGQRRIGSDPQVGDDLGAAFGECPAVTEAPDGNLRNVLPYLIEEAAARHYAEAVLTDRAGESW